MILLSKKKLDSNKLPATMTLMLRLSRARQLSGASVVRREPISLVIRTKNLFLEQVLIKFHLLFPLDNLTAWDKNLVQILPKLSKFQDLASTT